MHALHSIIEKVIKRIFQIVLSLLIVIIIIKNLIISPVKISGHSMEPLVKDHDILLYSKLLLTNLLTYSRGDIIHFEYIRTRRFIKKIIALPGETVTLTQNAVIIQSTTEGHIVHQVKTPVNQVIVLKENEYFVIGTNHKASQDSRHLGPIKEDQIQGIVLFKIWPWPERAKL